MLLRARRLDQSNSSPVNTHCFKNKRVYLTGKQIDALFQEAVKTFYPKTSKVDLSHYLAYLLRVWACILLNKSCCPLTSLSLVCDEWVIPSGCTYKTPVSFKTIIVISYKLSHYWVLGACQPIRHVYGRDRQHLGYIL